MSDASDVFGRDISIILGGNFTNYHYTTIVNVNPGSAHAWRLLNKKVASSAIHTSEAVERQEMCLEGTREAVLEALGAFLLASPSDSPSILWMTGPAGAGKSAIMRTIARNPKPRIVVLASFFFFRADITRNSHRPLIPTLVLQIIDNLRDHLPDLRQRVEVIIDNNPTTLSHSNNRQGEVLIVSVLVAALKEHSTFTPADTPFAILIDGLDECSGDDHQSEIIDALVNIIAKVNRQTRSQLKLIIASRPEPHIQNVFLEMEADGTARILKLDKSFNPDADIELFYDVHFTRIRRTHPLARILRLGPDWPSAQVKATLTRKASGQFAFPDTIIKFTKDPRGHPVTRLQMVLDNTGMDDDDSAQPFAALDQLYNTIFSTLPPHLRPLTMKALGALLAPPLIQSVHNDARSLAAFLRVPIDQLQHIFLLLTSLFEWNTTPSAIVGDFHSISVYHASLADFLFARNRSERFGLFIDPSTFAQAAIHHVFSPFTLSDGNMRTDERNTISQSRSISPLTLIHCFLDYPYGWRIFAHGLYGFPPHAHATDESLVQNLVNIDPTNLAPTRLACLAELDFYVRRSIGSTNNLHLLQAEDLPYPAFQAKLDAQLRRRRSVYLNSDAGRLSVALLFHNHRNMLPEQLLPSLIRECQLVEQYCYGDVIASCICSHLQDEDLKKLDRNTGWNMLDPNHSIYNWTSPAHSLSASAGDVPYLEARSGLQKEDFISICRYLLQPDTQAFLTSETFLHELVSRLSAWIPTIHETPPRPGDVAYMCLVLVQWWFGGELPATKEAALAIWPLARQILDKYPNDPNGRNVEFLDRFLQFVQKTTLLEGDNTLLYDHQVRDVVARLHALSTGRSLDGPEDECYDVDTVTDSEDSDLDEEGC